MITDKIALIDLDGTVADYDCAMASAMQLIQHPGETPYTSRMDQKGGKEMAYVERRRKLIQSKTGFWRNLDRLELGFDVVNALRELGFELHVLTKGPRDTPNAWSEKVEWCQEHLPDALVTISGDKSLVFGRVLVDDWPPYYNKWLEVRPRGLVVCVAHPWNEASDDPRIFRYDGTNINGLKHRLALAYERQPGETA